MVALSVLLDPGPLADDEVGGDFAFFVVGDFVLDVPVDVCGPGHFLVDLAGEVVPGEGTNAEAMSELD